MIKIKINEDILDIHREYIINSNIIDNFLKFKKDSAALDKLLKSEQKKEHENFCDFIINQVQELKKYSTIELVGRKNIFLGNVYNLHLINEQIIKSFPLLFDFINHKTDESIKYKDILLEYIGYEEFSGRKIFDFFELEYRLCNKYSKKYISDRLKEVKPVSKHNYSRDEFMVIYNDIIKDINNIEEVNNKNNTIDNNLKILSDEIEMHLNSNLTKSLYIDKIYDSLKKFKEKYKNGYISLKNYKEYMNRFSLNESQWNAYNYVFKMGIKVCPYCNRQYISPLYSEEGKVRADLDHFYSKSKYPYLAMAIYNLIPCCKFCNSSLKGDKEFTYQNNINPYDDELDEYMYFNYFPRSTDSFYGSDEIIIKLMERENADKEKVRKFKNNLKTFQIEGLYQYNTDILKLMLKKRIIFTNEYIDNFYNNYKNIFKNKDEIIQLLFNTSIDEDKDIPLSKLKKDMINQIVKNEHTKYIE